MNIDWSSLGFAYMDVNCHVRYVWRDGAWNEGTLCEDPSLKIHIAATALHYGQSAFEGLKAFSCKDGQIRVFRADENARRFQTTAARVRMPRVSEELFMDAVNRVVVANRDFVPPYGTGGSLYIRPLLFGSGPQIGIAPAREYVFLILVTPVGEYYKGGLTPVGAMIVDGYDRSAPDGMGHVKVAGNYAAGLEPSRIAKEHGFPINLYLDAREKRFVDEFGTSNFIGILPDGTYVTPDSKSVLPSVTNKTLMTLALENGQAVERRPIPVEELADFAEVAACGTAVVLTPVNRIVHGDREIRIGQGEGCGPYTQKLYTMVRGVQCGELPDQWGWTRVIDC